MDMEHEIKKADLPACAQVDCKYPVCACVSGGVCAAPSAQQAAGSIDTGELRRLAEAATPGPWSMCVGAGATEIRGTVDPALYDGITRPRVCRILRADHEAHANASLIAAANPSAILLLLNELDMVRSLYEGAHADRMALAAATHTDDFVAYALRAGLDMKQREDLEGESGEFPATYFSSATEAAWRAWANKPAATPAQPIAPAKMTGVIEALRFYAEGQHFVLHDADVFDTISGEPQNWQEDESNTIMFEDGAVAKRALDALVTAQPIADVSALRKVIHELRTYSPPGDRYNGVHIHPSWADKIEAAIAASADVSAPKVERVKQIAYFRKASEYGPWIECELAHPEGLRFTSMEDRPLGAGAADVSAPTDEHGIDYIMEAVQEFASQWSLVGGRFDRGDTLAQAEGTKKRIRTMLEDTAARAAAPVSGPTDAERYQLLRRKVCIAGGKFHILNLDPIYLASHAEIELDAAIDAQILATKE